MTHTSSHPHQNQPVARGGRPLDAARYAMLLVHGRGATAASILTLANEFPHPEFTYAAPQAAGNTWYPYSFLAPLENNQPGLDSGLQAIDELVKELVAAGIPRERMMLGGFSQGACLCSEYVARHATRYGGVFVYSGGVIGPPGTPRDYAGDLDGTPIFLGCSDIDPHIPLERVQESTAVFKELGAVVTERIYPRMAHTVNGDEIEFVRGMLDALVAD